VKPRDAKPAGVQVNRARRRDASGFEPRALSTNGYLGLLGETGAGMNDLEWIGHANEHLPANLAALTARFVEGSRDEQWLRVSYEPGPTAFNFTADLSDEHGHHIASATLVSHLVKDLGRLS